MKQSGNATARVRQNATSKTGISRRFLLTYRKTRKSTELPALEMPQGEKEGSVDHAGFPR
jgi:hypothetical protein